MNLPEPENRRKILRVDQREVLGLLRRMDALPKYLRVPVFEGLPLDVVVCGVHENYAARSFDFVLQHESFEAVAPGVVLPVMSAKSITVELAIEEGGTP